MMSECCILFLFLACFPKETKLTQLFCLTVRLLVCQPLFSNFEPVGWFQAGISPAGERTKSQCMALVGQQASPPPFGITAQPVGSSQAPERPSPGANSSERGKVPASRKALVKWEGRRPALCGGQKSVGSWVSLLLLFVEHVYLWRRRKRARRVSSTEVFLFLARVYAHRRLTVHVYSFFSLGFGSLGATEIQTGDVNNIAEGMLDLVVWYPRDGAYSLQFSESSWALKYPAPQSLNLLSIATISSCLFLQEGGLQISSIQLISVCPLCVFVPWKMRLCSCWLTDFKL